MTARFIALALLLTLTGCPTGAKRGDVGSYCKPDGTCNYPTLECRETPEMLGIPFDEASCHLKGAK